MGVEEIGAYFSPVALNDSSWKVLAQTPQIVNQSLQPITRTDGWTRISGSFVADGGERYMLIGVFVDDASVTTAPAVGGNGTLYFGEGAYYYVDSVSVTGPGAGAELDLEALAHADALDPDVPNFTNYTEDLV